jgi:hypothetical protein
MAMQYDVKQGHLNQSGFFVLGRNRVKGVSWYGGASDGTLVLFDTTTAPVTASVTYGRTGTLVTVTKTAHGLVTGDIVGIHFNSASGVAATDGNYSITRTGADTFTLVDINTGTVSTSATAAYVTGANRWLLTYENDSTDTFSNAPIIPGEGVLANNGIYALMTNISASQIYYG